MKRDAQPDIDFERYSSRLWRTEGLFSTHYLVKRLQAPGSALWPDQAESNAVFDSTRELLRKNLVGLRRGNEEDCEKRFVTPLLALLGFGHTNRMRLPEIERVLLPDYLLYADQAVADVAFQAGTPASYYSHCLALLEAKRWRHNLSEDASGKGKAHAGRSPHYQMRDYLSESDCAWGILTNGERWRLYCKHDRASHFFEFNLAAALTHDDTSADEARARSDFRFFFALFRRAMFEPREGRLRGLDAVRSESQQYKAEVEQSLRTQVFGCVELLAKGFLANDENRLSAERLREIYENSLTLLYRILFVLNAEARGLLPTQPVNQRARTYCSSYSLEFIRRRLMDRESGEEYADDKTFALWDRLRSLFSLINGQPGKRGKPDKNEELDIPRYNGGLFDPARHPFLEAKRVGDRFLAEVLKGLFYREEDGEKTSFDYANLGERHLGSIYEGLLEHRLTLTGNAPSLANDKGERKTTGSYYTPEAWVEYIVRSTIKPLLDRIDKEVRGANPGIARFEDTRWRRKTGATIDPSTVQNDAFAEKVLELNVCDPAMGSGHFLVEATMFLAEAAAQHITTRPRPEQNTDGSPQLKTDGSGAPLCTQEAKLSYWKRRIVESCIYGVDYNPLAVELSKLSLWLKTVDRVPLNFLDHHLRCGNSLIGTTVDLISRPPVRRRGRAFRAVEPDLPTFVMHRDEIAQAISEIHAIESAGADTHGAAKEKEAHWRRVSEEILPPYRRIADLWMTHFFGVPLEPPLDYAACLRDPARAAQAWETRQEVLGPLRAFHWEWEFPDLFFDKTGRPKKEPGFDAVIGNPPWERIKLQENEFFAGRSREIALAPRAADRKKLIAELPEKEPGLWSEYQTARERADRVLNFVHKSGFYPLMGRGDTNFYAVFAEKALQLTNPRGRTGLLLPSGIATDDTTKAFFQKLVKGRQLAELLDFENRNGVFADVHRSFKFSIILMTGPGDPQEAVRCGFFMHRIEEVHAPDRVFNLTPEDFKLFNPNTLTCPIFRRKRDAELTRRIYRASPVLIDRSRVPERNPWGIRFSTMFHMTNDSGLFKTAAELEKDGFWLGAGNVYTKGEGRYLPLYEGKMVQMYDHRAASIVVNPENIHRPANEAPTDPARYIDPAYSPNPLYWVRAQEVSRHLGREQPPWLLGYKDVTAPTNARTLIAAAIPFTAVGNTLCLVNSKQGAPRACLLANLSALAFDFSARQKVGGQHLNFFIVEQLPVLPPDRYAEPFHGIKPADFIRERVLELCYTAHDLSGFAEDLGYVDKKGRVRPPFKWDEERRLHLRCQLDALYFHLYGLTRDEASEILDTFPIVKRQDEARFNGRFRTKDLILSYHNAYAAGNMDAWVQG